MANNSTQVYVTDAWYSGKISTSDTSWTLLLKLKTIQQDPAFRDQVASTILKKKPQWRGCTHLFLGQNHNGSWVVYNHKVKWSHFFGTWVRDPRHYETGVKDIDEAPITEFGYDIGVGGADLTDPIGIYLINSTKDARDWWNHASFQEITCQKTCTERSSITE